MAAELTPREHSIVRLVAQGKKNADIAASFGMNEHLVKNYLREIYDKVGLWNRVELALWYEANFNSPQRSINH